MAHPFLLDEGIGSCTAHVTEQGFQRSTQPASLTLTGVSSQGPASIEADVCMPRKAIGPSRQNRTLVFEFVLIHGYVGSDIA
jgi:hypothetical protein